MPTLNQLIYQVKDTANKGMTNRASEVGDRLIARWVIKYSNYLTAQEIKRVGNVDQSFEYDLGCLTLEKVDAAVCSKYCWGEEPVYKVDLPVLLNLPNNMGLTYFGLISKANRINVSEYSYGNFTNLNRFTPRDAIYAELIGGTIYVHGVDPMFALEGCNARGVWADVSNLVTKSSPTVPISCFDWNTSNFPIPASMEAAIIDMIFVKELGIVRQAITDKKDDDVSEETL